MKASKALSTESVGRALAVFGRFYTVDQRTSQVVEASTPKKLPL
jgi:hypothetical protein